MCKFMIDVDLGVVYQLNIIDGLYHLHTVLNKFKSIMDVGYFPSLSYGE